MLTEKEKAVFVLEHHIRIIDESIQRSLERFNKLSQEIQHALSMKSKKLAVSLLSQRKKVEAYYERLYS